MSETEVTRSTEDAVLSVRDLCVGYGSSDTVLEEVSLDIYQGITLLLGRNGAGKTTLLKAVSGLVPTRAGKVELQGRDVARWSPQRRVREGIAHVPQGRRIVPGLTVMENLNAGGYLLSGKARRARVEILLDQFPTLQAHLKKDGTSLSGGQQQLLALARALVVDTTVLMLDEPFTGLAPSVVKDVVIAMQRLSEEGIAIFLVEQAVETGLEVAEHAYLLDRGTITHRISASDGAAALDTIRHAYLGVSGTEFVSNAS